MRCCCCCLVALLATALPAAAQPSPDQLRATFERIGFVDWRADVQLTQTKSDHVTASDGGHSSDDGDDGTWSATLAVSQYGNPPAAPQIDLQMKPEIYGVREASGATSSKYWAHNDEESDDWTYSGKALPQSATVEFHYTPSTKAWRVDVNVAFDADGEATFVKHTWQTHETTHDKTHEANRDHVWFHADNKTPGVQLTMKGDTFTIDGTIHKDSDTTDGPKHEVNKLAVTANIVIRPNKVPRYEAVLVPKDPAGYHAWVPLGPPIPDGDDSKGASQLAVQLEVRDAKTHLPALDVMYTPSYTLDTSHAPGWCMNFPAQSVANDKPDLFFEPGRNPAPHKASGDGTALDGFHMQGRDLVVVSSRDYGAFGHLHARVKLDDGTVLDAKSALASGGTEDGFAIPQDDDHNHIADAWERSTVYGHVSTWDEETDPSGMDNSGDGYGVYDEYRGFFVSQGNPDHPAYHRLDPKRRDLLIAVDAGGTLRDLLIAGANRYHDITQIGVWFVKSKDQLAHLDNDGNAAHPRWANFNAKPDSDPFGHRQAVVWLRGLPTHDPIDGNDRPPGRTVFVAPWVLPNEMGITTHHGTPMTTVWIDIMADNSDKLVLDNADFAEDPTANPGDNIIWARVLAWRGEHQLAKEHPDWGITPKGVADYARKHHAELASEVIEFATIHELGHATGGRHHMAEQVMAGLISEAKGYGGGDQACPMRYWQQNDGYAIIEFLLGKWNPVTAPPEGGRWKFCTEDWPQMRLHD